MGYMKDIMGVSTPSDEYEEALKAGKKYYRQMLRKGQYPYTAVLDQIVTEDEILGRTNMGLIDIPADFIVGTQSSGRVSAFAGNFMPLLNENSEFGIKWKNLCKAHLSDEGIRDPIVCLEYLGKFYVIEGNKRVSVLRHFGAPRIPALVTRVVPKYSDDTAIVVYYEFMKFYELTELYTVDFNYPGNYTELITALGKEPDHKWSESERREFNKNFYEFSQAYKPLKEYHPDITEAEALLGWLRVFKYSYIEKFPRREITSQIESIIPDVLAARHKERSVLSTEPTIGDASSMFKLFANQKSHLKAAFFFREGTDGNDWYNGHMLGMEHVKDLFGSSVTVDSYMVNENNILEVMEGACKGGADVVFATIPAMIDTARFLSTIYKNVKFLVCALALPYTGIRMYYTRTYECKFIAGAIAAIMSEENTISYTAHYPIYGTPANINAFALGASMVNPRCKVELHWSCVEGDKADESKIDGNSYARLRWNWGYFYERIIRSIFDGSWDSFDKNHAVNYWWGLSAGAADIVLSKNIPDSVRTLADNLKWNIIHKTLDPFHMTIYDQNGVLRNDGVNRLTPMERLNIDWLCDNVIGSIPELDDVMDMSKETVRLLGIHRDDAIRKTFTEVQK